MANRATMQDVAREAGVSLSTVDRALNGRVVVREETLRRIAAAAHRVGYHARGLVEQRLDEAMPEVRLGVILLETSREFYRNFARELEAEVLGRMDIRGSLTVRFARSQSPEEFARLLRELGAHVDAIACVAINHQKVSLAVQELKDRCVPVYALLSDLSQGIRRSYIGTNNMKVGRVAAWMLTHFIEAPGKLAIFVGGHRWHGHELRELGFRAFIREDASAFTVLDTLVNLDTRPVTYEATLDLLRRHHDLKGIYVAGGGMGGAIEALKEVRPPGKVALIVNELTSASRTALAEGYAIMVIDTPLREISRDLVDFVVRDVIKGDEGIAGQHFVMPRLVLSELL